MPNRTYDWSLAASMPRIMPGWSWSSTDQPGVVAGGDKIRTHAVGIVEQLAELDPVVAHHAGIGSAADRVLVDKVVNDLAEFGFQIQRVPGNAQPLRDACVHLRHPGHCNNPACDRPAGSARAAGGRFALAVDRTGRDGLFPVPHEHTGNVMSGLHQQVRSDAGIDTSGHCQYDSSHDRICLHTDRLEPALGHPAAVPQRNRNKTPFPAVVCRGRLRDNQVRDPPTVTGRRAGPFPR